MSEATMVEPIQHEEGSQAAIILARVWPGRPLAAVPETRIGGVPPIGGVAEWPRGGGNLPLHFLARVDCSELPQHGERLPASGHLLFFAALGEEAWQYRGRDAARVLHIDRLGSPATPPPGTPREDVGDWRVDLFGSHGGTVLPEWPLAMHAVETEREPDPYGASGERRVRAIERALGEPVGQPKGALSIHAGIAELFETDADVHFPFLGWQANHMVRALLARSEAGKRPAVADDVLSRLRAVSFASDATIDPEAARLLREAFARVDAYARSHAARPVVLESVRRAALDPAVRAITPDSFLRAVDPAFRFVRRDAAWMGQAGSGFYVETSVHQMLGHAPNAQSEWPDRTLLLQLASDRAGHLLFGDKGELEFWIDEADLAARRWDRVEVRLLSS